MYICVYVCAKTITSQYVWVFHFKVVFPISFGKSTIENMLLVARIPRHIYK